MVLIITVITAFWSIVNTLLSAFGVPALITQVHSAIQSFVGSMGFMQSVVANVYYFVPRSVLLPLLLLSVALVSLRIVLAIINLIWW